VPDTSDPRPAEDKPAREPRFLDRIGMLDQRFAFVRSLSIVTLLSSAAVGYFQYLNTYQDKVSNQAREDMKLATETFEGISTAFADTLALQNLLYSNFATAVRSKSEAKATALSTKNANEASRLYERAQTDLREKIDMMAQKAQVYIDWASDIDRDPASKRNVEADPLSFPLLRSYQFNCSDTVNFPEFGDADAKAPDKPVADIPDEKFCASERKQAIGKGTPQGNAFIRICPAGRNDVARKIHWFSAKHHVLTMQYCFDAMHARLEPVRQWASQSDRDTAKEGEIAAQAGEIAGALDDLARRLNSFDSLALYQIERIRVKYRPAGFECSVPGLRNLYAKSCLPLRTTTGLLPDGIKAVATDITKPVSRDPLVISSR
jgi:hypothetical protein